MAITITDFENIGAIALPAVSAAGNVRIVFDVADNLLKLSQNGGAYVPFGTSVTGGGWTDDGTNVRLTTSTDTVSIGTNSAPPVNIKSLFLTDVPTGNIRQITQWQATVSGGAATTGTGLSHRWVLDNDAGTPTIAAECGTAWGTPTAGAENAGYLVRLAVAGGVADRWLFTPNNFGGYDSPVFGGGDAVISLDIGPAALAMGPGGGAAQDWRLERTAAGVASIANGDTLNFDVGAFLRWSAGNPEQWTMQISGTELQINSADVSGSGGSTASYRLSTGVGTNNAGLGGVDSGALVLSTGNTTATGAGAGGNTGSVQILTGLAQAGTSTSGATGVITIQTGDSASAASGGIVIQTGTAGTTRGNITLSALAITFNEGSLTNLAVGSRDASDGQIDAGFWVSKTYPAGAGPTTFTLPARVGGWRVVDAYIVANGAGGTLAIARDIDGLAIVGAMTEGGGNVIDRAGTCDLTTGLIASAGNVRLTGVVGTSGGTCFVRIEPR